MCSEKNQLILCSFLAQCGLGSRRSCEKLITTGQIKINDSVVKALNTSVNPECAKVTCKGVRLELQPKRYMLLHKPRGYVCSAKDKHASKLVFDLLEPSPKERLFTIGRLDKNSEGLLLLTNDGYFAQMLTHPRYMIKKTYVVKVTGRIRDKDLRLLEAGITEGGDKLKATSAEILKRTNTSGTLRLTITEGRKREVRRMCQFLNYDVSRLMRTAIGSLKLGSFKPGYYRDLSRKEIEMLKRPI